MSCAECKRKASVYVVEFKKSFCKDCLGRVVYPGINSFVTIEPLMANQRPEVKMITTAIMHTSVVVLLVVSLWNSGIGDEYFRGNSVCPLLSIPRYAVALADPNVFYYFKPNFATYCDTEDSFWRLLQDAWFRGIVGGADSMLLLLATAQKAWLFKTAVTAFLGPIYAMLYAICGIVLAYAVEKMEEAGQALIPARVQDWMAGSSSSNSPVVRHAKSVLRIPTTMIKAIYAKKVWFNNLQYIFFALGLGAVIRFAVWGMGFTRLAKMGSSDANLWQMAAEPILFFYFASLCSTADLWVKKQLGVKPVLRGPLARGPLPPLDAPLTQWRYNHCKDHIDLLYYTKDRVSRQYTSFKKEANVILHLLLDDIFNFVVVLRVLGILFEGGPFARSVLRLVGFNSVIDRHTSWLQDSTGISDFDHGAKYVSDRLASFGIHQLFYVSSVVRGTVQGEALKTFSSADVTLQVFWRILVPLGLYQLELKFAAWRLEKDLAQKKAWQGKDWTDGEFAEMLKEHGTFWNKVDSKEEWKPEPPPKKKR